MCVCVRVVSHKRHKTHTMFLAVRARALTLQNFTLTTTRFAARCAAIRCTPRVVSHALRSAQLHRARNAVKVAVSCAAGRAQRRSRAPHDSWDRTRTNRTGCPMYAAGCNPPAPLEILPHIGTIAPTLPATSHTARQGGTPCPGCCVARQSDSTSSQPPSFSDDCTATPLEGAVAGESVGLPDLGVLL